MVGKTHWFIVVLGPRAFLFVFLFVVVFGFVFVGLSRDGGEGLKLLWCAKPLVYCGFGASKGDTLCGFVFCFLEKKVLLKTIPFLFLFPFVFGVGFVFGTLCPGAARQSQAVRAA